MKKLLLAVLASACCLPAFAAEEVPQTVDFTTSDAWKIHAVYLPPQPERPLALLLHSMGASRAEWDTLEKKLAKEGMGYLALDFRGHGESVTDATGAAVTYKTFRKSGQDNEYNAMLKDSEAALAFATGKGTEESRIVLVGAGLGANIAVKTAALHKGVAMLALLSPSLNAGRDVLSVNPLREYGKRPVLIVNSVEDSRLHREVELLRGVARISAGKHNVTYITAYSGSGTELLTPEVTARFMQWIKTPFMPRENAKPEADNGAATEEPEDK